MKVVILKVFRGYVNEIRNYDFKKNCEKLYKMRNIFFGQVKTDFNQLKKIVIVA